MAPRYSVAEARAHLPSIIEQAEAGVAVELTRRGRPVVVVAKIEAHAHESALAAPVWHELRYGSRLLPPGKRRTALNADFVGFEAGDEFLVGYGLDWAHRFRGLPYIGIVEQTG